MSEHKALCDITVYIQEFVAVIDHCQRERIGEKLNRGRFAIEQPELIELLNEHQYDEAVAKFALWKKLHWILTDKNRFTQCIYLKSKKKNVRMVVINMDVYNELKKFC